MFVELYSFRLDKVCIKLSFNNKLIIHYLLNSLRLEKVYCRHIGLEFMYFNSNEKLQFVREKFETPGASDLDNDARKTILKRLTKAVVFELYVAKKWQKTKRFGLEGAESLIPGMKQVIDR